MAKKNSTSRKKEQEEYPFVRNPAGAHLPVAFLKLPIEYQPIIDAGAEAASKYVCDCQSFIEPERACPGGYAAMFISKWIHQDEDAYFEASDAAREMGVGNPQGNFSSMFELAFMVRIQQELQRIPRDSFHNHPVTHETIQ